MKKDKIYTNLEYVKTIGIQGTCVKDCCSHGAIGGITSKWTCYHFSHSWQVNDLIYLVKCQLVI